MQTGHVHAGVTGLTQIVMAWSCKLSPHKLKTSTLYLKTLKTWLATRLEASWDHNLVPRTLSKLVLNQNHGQIPLSFVDFRDYIPGKI